MSALSTGETSRDGQPVPEEEVERGGPEVMSFQAQAAETAEFGPKGGRRRTTGETPVPSEAGQTFQAREAETVTERPPHWENLPEVPAEAETPMETKPQAPANGPSGPQSETPASPSSMAGDEPGPAYEGPGIEKEKES